MKKSGYYKSIISLGLLLCAGKAEAIIPIPTIDVGAIAEGVKTNIELVKQSKNVIDAAKITGQIKSVTGSPQSSMSDLQASEAAEEQEKEQKEDENLQAAAQAYEEYKEEVEAAQEEKEKNKEKLNNFKNKAVDIYTTAKSKYEEGKEVYEQVAPLYEEMTEEENTETPQEPDVMPTRGSDSNTNSGTTPQTTSTAPQTVFYSNTTPTQSEPQGPSDNQELEEAQAEIEQLRAALAALEAQQKGAANEEQTDTEVITDLEAAEAEIERLKAELAKYQMQEDAPQTDPMTVDAPASETEEASQTEETEETSQTEETEEKPTTTGGFRKAPEINTNEVFEKTSCLENNIYTASREYKEVLKFAKEEQAEPSPNTPTGMNTRTDEFIMSDELARYCGINVNNTSESELTECVDKLIEYRSSTDATEAEKAEKLIKKILYDTSTALVAEAMTGKLRAGNYKEEVLGEKKKAEAQAQTTVRDDISVLSSNIALMQELLSNINKIYASRLIAESMQEATKYKLQDIGKEPSNTSETNTEESSGEK